MPEPATDLVVFCFPMRPSRLSSGKNDLFRERLDVIIDKRHPLVRLAAMIRWPRLDAAFGGFYRPLCRPAKPTRLTVGLHYSKHVHDLSDEEVVDRQVENPYWQVFAAASSPSTRHRSTRAQ